MSVPVRFGLTLPNRGVLFGVETIGELIALGEEAEASGLFQSLWVGDSLLAKRRPEAVTLLAALAARTRRVRLAVGCMASFPIRHPLLLAIQWATLDLIAGPNRLILAACLGGAGGGGDWQMEEEAFGVPQRERIGRLEEGIAVLRTVWTQSPASFAGRYYQFREVVVEPRPLTRPAPAIWIASNPRPTARASAQANITRATRRVARLADGWMTTWLTPAEFAARWGDIQVALREVGRDPAQFDTTLYYNVNINEDREAAAAESKRFLDTYYGFDLERPRLDVWVAYGSPAEVIAKLQQFAEAGAREITLRLTSWDQRGQYRRLVEEVLPAFAGARVG
ncbi:MAG: N5,N10-methylene tetrahydromethanopterin reductase [Dehalococcoidia bacterium]|nr:MAG: N5,N10-methylene tetrahydromethanopterin reductase [Dehalococcoidia bacterium]